MRAQTILIRICQINCFLPKYLRFYWARFKKEIMVCLKMNAKYAVKELTNLNVVSFQSGNKKNLSF